MSEESQQLAHIGRRDHQRLRLRLPAEMIVLAGTQPVLLLDLSQSGARLAIRSAPRFKQGYLRWLEFETFGETVWVEGNMFGLRFDEELAADILLRTRALAPDEWQRQSDEQSDEVLEYARAWATGQP